MLLTLSACETQRERVERTQVIIQGIDCVTVAWVNSAERCQIVGESLSEIGISSATEGSMVYAVEVPKADYVRAIWKLKHEPKLKGKWIRFI
jgi:hypothetical protein